MHIRKTIVEDLEQKKVFKKRRLISLAESILRDPTYKNEIKELMARLNLTESQVLQSFVDYDLDVFAYGNEIYDSPFIHIVLHLHNLLKGSWHIERQRAVLELITIAQPKTIIDLGFGVPSLYIKELLKAQSVSVTLCDMAEEAIAFAKILLDIWDSQWRSRISFIKTDMRDVPNVVGKYDLYLFQDSIEHVQDATSCLSQYVNLSPKDARFLLSLPICPPIPMHYIAWESKESAHLWLDQCGLNIMINEEVAVNPEVDLFASEMDDRPINYIVLCEKK